MQGVILTISNLVIGISNVKAFNQNFNFAIQYKINNFHCPGNSVVYQV